MKDKLVKDGILKYLIIILIGIFAFWTINNLSTIFNLIKYILVVLSPFIVGGSIAFVLNIPMKRIEKYFQSHTKLSKNKIRILSIIISLFLFLLIILLVAFLLIPELVENIKLLINSIPILVGKIEDPIMDLLKRYPDIQSKLLEIFNSASGNNLITSILNYVASTSLNFITKIVSGFITFFTAIVFAIYLLSQKEYIIRGCKKVIFAMFNESKANDILKIGKLINKTFEDFISGQCLEATILGTILFIISLIFKFPYALIIAILTTLTALIPIFGAIIAMVTGAILIAITSPIKALIFIIVFLVVQQIEGNLIYPRVVGKKVGLAPMWTLLSISVGGSLFGIIGMFISLPITSIIYTLIKDKINIKLKRKEIKIN